MLNCCWSANEIYNHEHFFVNPAHILPVCKIIDPQKKRLCGIFRTVYTNDVHVHVHLYVYTLYMHFMHFILTCTYMYMQPFHIVFIYLQCTCSVGHLGVWGELYVHVRVHACAYYLPQNYVYTSTPVHQYTHEHCCFVGISTMYSIVFMFTCMYVGAWGELVNHKRSLTHHPSCQGWASRCPIHFVFARLYCLGVVYWVWVFFICD